MRNFILQENIIVNVRSVRHATTCKSLFRVISVICLIDFTLFSNITYISRPTIYTVIIIMPRITQKAIGVLLISIMVLVQTR